MPSDKDNTMWNRGTLGLLVGSTLAGIGFWIDFLAILTLAAYVYKANAYVMALVSAMFLVPGMLVGPRVGRWIDRGNPQAILLASLVLRAAATALLLFSPSILVFCVLVALRSTLTVPTEPAGNALVTRLVLREDVPRYFGVLGVLRNVSKIVAPTLGAGIASQFGEGTALSLSITITLFAVLLMFLTLPSTARQTASAAQKSADSQPSSGAAAIAGSINRTLLNQLLWTVTIYVFMVFLVNNQLPVLLRNGGFDKALVGILVSCSGAGGILAATFMSRKGAPAIFGIDPMRATIVSILVTAGCFFALGLAFALPTGAAAYVAGALFFCTGIFSSIEAIRANTVVVQEFSSSVGAVSGTIQAYQSGAMLIAPWVAALAIPYVTMSTLFMVDGAVALLGVLAVSAVFHRVHSKTRVSAAPV